MKKENRKLPSEILDSRPELVETRIGILKGLIGSVPGVGTIINELFFDIPNRISQSRINEMVKILTNKLEFLDANTIKRDYLESEDFFDFSRQMLESCLKIKSEEKRIVLANIYIDTFIKMADYDISKYRLFMDFVTELSPIQINILKFVESKSENLIEIGEYSKFYVIYSSENLSIKLDKYEFKYYCNDLENKSLISFGDGLTDFESSASQMAFLDHKESSVIITMLGTEFIAYIRDDIFQ